MSPNLFRIVIAIAFSGHGIGHIMGILPMFGIKLSKTHSDQSWLLSSWLPVVAVKPLEVVILVATLVFFLMAGLSLFKVMNIEKWSGYAVLAAWLSLAGLAMFWNAFPFLFPNKVGIICVDLFVLLSVYKTNWIENLIN